MGLFRKKDELARYEADWPEDASYDQPLDDGFLDTEEDYVSSPRQNRLRVILMAVAGYVLFITVGVAVTYMYPIVHPFHTPINVSVQNWNERSSYTVMDNEYTTLENLWLKDAVLNAQTVAAVRGKQSLVSEQMLYSQYSAGLAQEIQRTTTLAVAPEYQEYLSQLVSVEKEMQQFNDLMSTALVNQDGNSSSQAIALDPQITSDLQTIGQNLSGIRTVLHIQQ